MAVACLRSGIFESASPREFGLARTRLAVLRGGAFRLKPIGDKQQTTTQVVSVNFVFSYLNHQLIPQRIYGGLYLAGLALLSKTASSILLNGMLP